MMNVLDYLYIGLYRLLLKTNQKDIAEFSALTFLTVGLSVYLFIMLDHLYLNPTKYFPVRFVGFATTILIGIANYFRYIRSGRYKNLYEDIIKKSRQQQRVCSIISLAFFVGSLLAVLFIKKATT
jgi:hypothetical protein